ncbi:MAG: mobile mystery protein B [Acidimicrobiales bacterium]
MTADDAHLPPVPSPTFNLRSIGPEPDGATPIDEDDLADLIPDFVATRADLNLVEYENIANALPWARAQAMRGGPRRILEHSLIFELHKRMFGDVWKWAGTQRTRVTNIGVEPSQITNQTKLIVDDAMWWHDHDTYMVDERAARIHRRLVAVHPFRYGNGRCTRLFADLYLVSIAQPAFTWGIGGRLDETSDARRLYLDALRVADNDDYEPLVRFARS